MIRQEEREIHIMKNIDSVQNPRKAVEKLQTKKERDKKVYFCRRIPLSRGSFEDRNCNRTYRFRSDRPSERLTVNDVEMYIVPEAIVKYFVKQKRRKVYLLFVRSMRKK